MGTATLIDTGTPKETTAELVAWVKERWQEEERVMVSSSNHDTAPSSFDELRMTVHEALRTIGRCTERLLAGEDVKTVIRDHHHAQVALGVVPKKTQELIKKIEQEGGAAKVIGAGGRTGGAGIVFALGSPPSSMNFPVISL